MNTLLLDASVWLAVLDTGDRFHEPAGRLVDLAETGQVSLAALDLTGYETTNVAVTKWRDRGAATVLVELIDAFCAGRLVRSSSDLLRRAIKLANAKDITVYDAAYPAAAKLNGWTLASCDMSDLVGKRLAIDPFIAVEQSSG